MVTTSLLIAAETWATHLKASAMLSLKQVKRTTLLEMMVLAQRLEGGRMKIVEVRWVQRKGGRGSRSASHNL